MLSLSLWLRLFFVVVVSVLVTKKKSKFHSQKDLFSTLQRLAGSGMGIGDREDPLFGPLMQRSVEQGLEHYFSYSRLV